MERFTAQDPVDFAGGDTNLCGYVHESPTFLIDALGLRPLTECEKRRLAPFIPMIDLNSADIRENEVHPLQPGWADGFTLHNDIYFRPGAFDPGTVIGIALLGHELVHVGQFRLGMTILGYLMHGYDNNPYEEQASAIQRKIENELSQGCPCE
jgi:Domain of unknown function (DUF4157)